MDDWLLVKQIESSIDEMTIILEIINTLRHKNENNQPPETFYPGLQPAGVMLRFGMVFIPVFPFLIDEMGASGSALGLLVR